MRWNSLLSRIIPQDAVDLDDLTRRYDRRSVTPGRDIFPEIGPTLHGEGRFQRADMVCIGLTVAAPLPDACDQAMRLAGLAAEQDVEVIVLSHVDLTGLERFGFRIERISGDAGTRERCEEQIRQFWAIDLVL